jgi:hypothetical protein
MTGLTCVYYCTTDTTCILHIVGLPVTGIHIAGCFRLLMACFLPVQGVVCCSLWLPSNPRLPAVAMNHQQVTSNDRLVLWCT